MKTIRTLRPRSRQAGVGLIEVMVAVLVMAVGMLGIAAMQATALRNSQSSLERSQAVVQTYAVLDAMRANLNAARAGAYDTPLQCNAAIGGTLAQNDRAAWLQGLKRTLGEQACGAIVCAGIAGSDARECTITVQWNDERGAGGDAAQQVITRTRV